MHQYRNLDPCIQLWGGTRTIGTATDLRFWIGQNGDEHIHVQFESYTAIILTPLKEVKNYVIVSFLQSMHCSQTSTYIVWLPNKVTSLKLSFI